MPVAGATWWLEKCKHAGRFPSLWELHFPKAVKSTFMSALLGSAALVPAGAGLINQVVHLGSAVDVSSLHTCAS